MIQELKNTAVKAALKAGSILKKGFGTSFSIYNKEGKNNLVTEYDHKAEDAIIGIINKEFPNHSFLAEESGNSGINQDGSTVKWVIDPLDGTVNFANNLPIFCVSIAAEYKNEIIVGVIYQPILNELFVAAKGGGSFLNNKKIEVSRNNDLDKAFLVTGFPYNVSENPCGCIDHFVSFIKKSIPVRRLGSAALDLAYVAAGRFDGFWEVNLNPWDVAAGEILIREAGGLVTQYNGSKYNIYSESILATNGQIHSNTSKVLSSCKCEL